MNTVRKNELRATAECQRLNRVEGFVVERDLILFRLFAPKIKMRNQEINPFILSRKETSSVIVLMLRSLVRPNWEVSFDDHLCINIYDGELPSYAPGYPCRGGIPIFLTRASYPNQAALST